jgi:hypothetical protein
MAHSLQTGVKADFSFGKSSDFMIGISNATDYRDPPNPNKKIVLDAVFPIHHG